jgi:hypothetical protein
MKYHFAESLQDYPGNPLGHLSYCFAKCAKDFKRPDLDDEEKTCTGSRF